LFVKNIKTQLATEDFVKKSFVIAGFAAFTALTAFSSAQADERWPRWYIGLTGGYTYMSDEDVSSANSANKLSLNDGFGVGGSIGYLPSSSSPLINALRFEAEVTYHQNGVKSVRFDNGTSVGASGSYDSTAYMFNAFYDLPIAGSAWSPYIGAGIGMATLHLPTSSGAGNATSSDNEFAYQGLVGIGYSPESIPNTQWLLGYRYLATSDAKFSGTSVDYSTSSLEAGVHLKF
jgi:outer membrane protein W